MKKRSETPSSGSRLQARRRSLTAGKESSAISGRIACENARLLSALKESDRRKDEFLATLAHELRNPLAPIGNAVQIYRAKGVSVPELQWATEVIDRQIHQMTRLLDDLLSRITQGKIELRKERVELAEVVNSAVEVGRPLIEKWGMDSRSRSHESRSRSKRT
jgi:signal transduction histidine kinase